MALTYSQLQAIATKYIEKKLAENVLSTNALTAYLSAPGRLKLRDGGEKLTFPVTIGDENDSTGAWYEGSEGLDNTEYENISAAEFDWKNIHETIKISHPELNKASGDNAKLDLLASKVNLAKKYMAGRMGTAIHSGDGTLKNFVGLSTLISTSSTYGGIATADFAEWISTVTANGGSLRALTLALMQATEGGLTFDKDKPNLRVCRQNVYDKMFSLIQPYQRLVEKDPEMSKLGFPDIPIFNGIPTIIDSRTAASKMRYLNTEYLFLIAHQNENMKVVSHENLEGSDAIQRRIFFMGALCCNGRRYQGSLDDITV